METDYLQVYEVADLLHVPRRRVKRLAASGELPVIVLPSGEYRFPRAALLRTIAGWRKPSGTVTDDQLRRARGLDDESQ